MVLRGSARMFVKLRQWLDAFAPNPCLNLLSSLRAIAGCTCRNNVFERTVPTLAHGDNMIPSSCLTAAIRTQTTKFESQSFLRFKGDWLDSAFSTVSMLLASPSIIRILCIATPSFCICTRSTVTSPNLCLQLPTTANTTPVISTFPISLAFPARRLLGAASPRAIFTDTGKATSTTSVNIKMLNWLPMLPFCAPFHACLLQRIVLFNCYPNFLCRNFVGPDFRYCHRLLFHYA